MPNNYGRDVSPFAKFQDGDNPGDFINRKQRLVARVNIYDLFRLESDEIR